jgi:hypothetical protein
VPASEPVVVLVDDRLQSVLAAAAHGWEELHRGSWRFDLDGEHHHEAMAWPGELDRVLADLRKRKPARIIAFVSAQAFAPALRKDAIGLATQAERLELREDRLEVTGKRALPAVRSWKRTSRVTDVRALALPADDAKLIEQLEGAPWVALSAEFGRLAFDFAEVLVAVIPSQAAIEDGSAIELLGEWLRFEPEAKAPAAAVEPKPEPAKPEPAKPEPAKPAVDPSTPQDDPSKAKKVLPWVGVATVLVAGVLGVVFMCTPPEDPCRTRKLDISKDKLSIAEVNDPECRGPEPIRFYTHDSRNQPIVATLEVQGAANKIDTRSNGFAELRLDSIPLGDLAIAVTVGGRPREIIEREQGATAQDVILTLADSCRFAFVDDKGQALTGITNPTLSFAAGKPTLEFDDAAKKWIPSFCPKREDTLTIGGTRNDRTCSRSVGAESLLDSETLPWCGATCSIQVVDESGKAVLDAREVELHTAGSQPVPLNDAKQGKWEFQCDTDGFAGKFAPERITYARGSEVGLELACNDDTWSRTCKLASAGVEDEGGDDGGDGGGGEHREAECDADTQDRVFDMAASEGLSCPGRTIEIRFLRGKLVQPSIWKPKLGDLSLGTTSCKSTGVRCSL